MNNPAPSSARTSALLQKASSFGLRLPQDLERLAVQRGCGYYDSGLAGERQPVAEAPLTDAELAVALLSPSLSPTAQQIRIAAAMLSSPNVLPGELVKLAQTEDCAGTVRYIAECGRRYEPENPFWTQLLRSLPEVPVDRDALPHPTRFIEMTGMIRGQVGFFTHWIRPRQKVAA